MRKLLVCVLFIVPALFSALIAYGCFDMARMERARPAFHTRIVLSFEGVKDPRLLESVPEILRARLKAAGAWESAIEFQPTNTVVVEYRPKSADETDSEAGERLRRPSRLRFLVHAVPSDIPDSSLAREQEKVEAWRAAHPGVSSERFNALSPEAGGPVSGLSWYPARQTSKTPDPAEVWVPMVVPKPAWRFGTDDLGHVGFGSDEFGFPAVTFEMKPPRRQAFGDFTESILDRGMAIVLDDRIITLATVHGRLEGQAQISGGRGGFTKEEVRDMITILRAGALPSEPVIVSVDHVAAPRGAMLNLLYACAGVALVVAVALVVLCVRRLMKPSPSPPASSAPGGEDWSAPADKR